MDNNIKILYVDDEELNVEVFEITFSENYTVITATDGITGIELIKQNPDIQFVISDMKMPELNGLELIREIKKINNSLPCMLLSGYDPNSEIQDALKEGIIIDYMMKPFSRIKIEKLIEMNVG